MIQVSRIAGGVDAVTGNMEQHGKKAKSAATYK
jgi:hypothetical protein